MLKIWTLFTFLSVLINAQDFMTGQGARAVIGQPTFTAQEFGTARTDRFGGVGGLAFANGTLYATDANRLALAPNNNRVLFFNAISSAFPGRDAEIAPFKGRCPVCATIAASLVLGDKDATKTPPEPIAATTRTGFRQPVAVASDGKVLVVADTNNNRVLIWNPLPTTDSAPATVVLGQTNFTTVGPLVVNANSFRSPQGVWIQGSRLFVADTQNDRILIWNTIPTQNNQPADVVLGQPDFVTAPPISQVLTTLVANSKIMLSPTSVTSDGTRLIVSDLGYNRVLIWNSIPTSNQKAADVVIGQPDFAGSLVNNSPKLCTTTGNDAAGNALYPVRCKATLNFPRYALSDGNSLFIADTGNDRVLVYKTISTTQNGAGADAILGQSDEFVDLYVGTDELVLSASNLLPTPTSLAWDPSAKNLYIADPTDYRILVYSPAGDSIPPNAIVNAASREVFAVASITIGGTVRVKDAITVKLSGTSYTYTIKADDTLDSVARGLVNAINTANSGNGDPKALAYTQNNLPTVRLVAKKQGTEGNSVTLEATPATNSQITAAASGAVFTGGASTAQVSPGTLVFIRGKDLAERTIESADQSPVRPKGNLPFELGNVQVYFDGIRAPIFKVSPTEIGTQVPFASTGSNSVTAWVRTKRANGTIMVTDAIGVPLLAQNPGIFAKEGLEPREAIAVHASDNAIGTLGIFGSTLGGETATITIGGDEIYTYTTQITDTVETVRDALVDIINSNSNSRVVAKAVDQRIRLTSKLAGPAGNLISLASTVTTSAGTEGGQLIISPTIPLICCYGFANQLVTKDRPAVPGESIIVYSTGLGLLGPTVARKAQQDGVPYDGTFGIPRSIVSSLAGGSTANVISASMLKGAVGVYEVVLELNPNLGSNDRTEMTIAQAFTTSNIVTIPIFRGGAEVYVVTASAATVATGGTLTFTVRTTDSKGGPVTDYTGTFSVTSSDTGATLPSAAVAVTNGTATFAVVFKNTGTQTVTVADALNTTVRGTATITVQ